MKAEKIIDCFDEFLERIAPALGNKLGMMDISRTWHPPGQGEFQIDSEVDSTTETISVWLEIYTDTPAGVDQLLGEFIAMGATKYADSADVSIDGKIITFTLESSI